MGLVGSLVKMGVEFNQKLNFNQRSPVFQQKQQLQKLLEKAVDTSFGKYYGFKSLLKSDNLLRDYRKNIPLFEYDDMYEKWWKIQLERPDITWPGSPGFFALSSGTTGKTSKKIPITDDFIQSMRDVGFSTVKSLPDFNFPESLFESEILILSSTAHLNKNEKGHFEGEISGINVNNFPGWYDLFYRPGKEISSISNWDDRLKRIVEEAPEWNIGAIAGITSWILLMLQEIIKGHNLKNIHEIWPNFEVYASGGVAFDTYAKDFEAVCGKPVTVMDTYLASEGFFAYTARPDTMDMKLALSHGYFFEFIPFDSRGVNDKGDILENPVTHTIGDVEEDTEYVLVVSTCAGAWRYIVGDTIRFINKKRSEIKITGRTKFYLNVTGSQLSEEKMDDAIIHASGEEGITVNEFSVAAVRNDDGNYKHQWVVVSDGEIDEVRFAKTLDGYLQEANKNYGVARSRALKSVEVKAISKDMYYGYLENSNKKGGQVKTPKVMSEVKMKEYLAFLMD